MRGWPSSVATTPAGQGGRGAGPDSISPARWRDQAGPPRVRPVRRRNRVPDDPVGHRSSGGTMASSSRSSGRLRRQARQFALPQPPPGAFRPGRQAGNLKEHRFEMRTPHRRIARCRPRPRPTTGARSRSSHGVTIVTTRAADGAPTGLTVNSFNSFRSNRRSSYGASLSGEFLEAFRAAGTTPSTCCRRAARRRKTFADRRRTASPRCVA